MRGKYGFREPLMMDEEGLYITAAQMQFFLNRRDGQKKFESCSVEFLNYYRNSCLYNLVYDLMEQDSSCATMYWDHENNTLSLSFPWKGIVADTLANVSYGGAEEYDSYDDDELDEDPFNLF